MGAYLCKAFNSLFRTSKAHAVAINPGKSTVSRQAVPLALKLTRLLVYLLNFTGTGGSLGGATLVQCSALSGTATRNQVA